MRFRHRATFLDVDFGRMIFSGNYYAWVERSFDTWQADLGLSWRALIEEAGFGMVTTETRCHYVRPIRMMEEFEVALGIRDVDERGIVTDFEFVRVEDGGLCAHGYFRRRYFDIRSGSASAAPPEDVAETYRRMTALSSALPYEERRHQLAQAPSRTGGRP